MAGSQVWDWVGILLSPENCLSRLQARSEFLLSVSFFRRMGKVSYARQGLKPGLFSTIGRFVTGGVPVQFNRLGLGIGAGAAPQCLRPGKSSSETVRAGLES